jgi:phage-related minor tail protein
VARGLSFVIQGVDKLTGTLKRVGRSLDNAQKDLEKFQDAANKIGIGAGVAFGAGLVGAINVDAGQAKLSAQLGLTGKEAKRIGGVAGKVFAGAFGDSMEEVNGAVASVVQNMDGMRKASSASLQATTERALTLAQVMGEDVTKVTAAVGTLMRTGLAKDSTQAFDVITRGAQLGANKQQDLLDTLTEYPTLFRNMGIDAQTATGLLVQGLQAGARDSDKVADAIKEFSIRAVDGSKLTAQGFEMIGLNADTMASRIGKGGKSASAALQLTLDKLRGIKDPVLQSQAAVALFGTQAEDLGKALFALDLDGASKKMTGFGGATDRASKTIGDSASSRIEAFKRSILSAFTNAIGNIAIPAITKLQTIMQNLGLKPEAFVIVAGAIAGLAAAVKIANFAILTFRGETALATVATKLWAAATWLVNAAMRANPIGIVITVIAALVAGIIYAYKNSETFRKIVQAAWAGIQAAVKFAWNNIIKPVLAALVSYYQNVLGPVIMWLWNNIIKPAWAAISFAIKVAWGIIKIIFAAIKFYVEKILAPVFLWVWKNIITPAWNAISAVISKVWNSGVKPVFEVMKKGVELVGKAFESAKTFIGKVWDKVRELALKPVRFIVETVYTKGIKAVWDKVADFVHADHLPAAPKFATGGKVNVGTTGKADDVLARLSKGEFVVNAKATRKHAGLLAQINSGANRADVKNAMKYGDPGGMLPGFAGGGIVGWVADFARKAKDWFIDGIASAADGVFNPIKGLIDNTLGTTGIGGMIGGVPKSYMNDFKTWLLSHKSDFEGGNGMKAVQAARSQIGVPYSWGGGGPGGKSRGFAQGANTVGFDCSSLMQYAWYKATGNVAPRTSETQYPWTTRLGSKAIPGDLGFTHFGSRGPGHVVMYSGKGKVIQAPHTGAYVNENGSASGYVWGRPPASFMRADNGVANLRPGMNVVNNGTGRMEPLMSPDKAGSVTINEMHLHFADDRNMYEKGKHFAEGLTVYTKRAGKGWAKNIGLTP